MSKVYLVTISENYLIRAESEDIATEAAIDELFDNSDISVNVEEVNESSLDNLQKEMIIETED